MSLPPSNNITNMGNDVSMPTKCVESCSVGFGLPWLCHYTCSCYHSNSSLINDAGTVLIVPMVTEAISVFQMYPTVINATVDMVTMETTYLHKITERGC